jgi:hypothetical protein
LSDSVVLVLALYSFGMIVARASGLSVVALAVTKVAGGLYHALRKRLAEFYKEAPAKSGVNQGSKRRDFDVTTCFAPLLRWVLSLWAGRHLPLAIDVTNLGERFHVLCVSVVVAGVGIPVAWKVLQGGVKEPWNPHWRALLQSLKKAVPDDWTVVVLSDRGLESPWLFGVIKGLGWHPLMRAKKGGKFRPKGWGRFYVMGELVRRVGTTFYAEGRAYAGEAMPCTLLACFQEGYDEPWLVLTDLPPEVGNAAWYAFRAWIEQGFKIIKGGGWDWDKTRMEDPGRVERLWLVMAVATLWVVAVGVEDEVRQGQQEALQRLQRSLTETVEQARLRQAREEVRLQRQREALQARQARKVKQEAARKEQREKAREEKKGKGKAGKGSAQQKKATPRRKTQTQEGARVRIHRVSRRGLAELHALWLKGQNRLPRHLHPETWPALTHQVSTLTEEEFLSQQT